MFQSILNIFHRHGKEEKQALKKSYRNTLKTIQDVERIVIDRLQAQHEVIIKRWRTKVKPNGDVEIIEEIDDPK